MKRILPGLTLVATLVAGCTIEPATPGADVGEEEPEFLVQVQDMLARQAAAWNRGDLEGFMSAYERSPATTYIGAPGLVNGFDAIQRRYEPYFGPGAERDSLTFADVVARELDPRFGIATARYVLSRGDEVTSTGPFTLVLVRGEGAWRIVHDQSAADPLPDEP